MFLNTKLNILLPITVFFILGIAYSNSGYSLFSSKLMLCALILGLIIVTLIIFATKLIPEKIFSKISSKKTPKILSRKIFTLDIFSRKNIIIFFLLTLAFGLGIFCHKQQIQNHTDFLNKIENKTYETVIARVKDIKKLENRRNPMYLELLWEKSDLNSQNKLFSNKKISLYTNRCKDLQVGDEIEIKNVTFKKPTSDDFVKYLIKEDIATTLFITDLDYKIISRPQFSVARWLHNKKNNILYSLKEKMSPVVFAAFSSIFLGNKNISKNIEDDIKNKFKEWGILHILARSGLHLIIFLLICDLLFKFIPIYFLFKQIIILLLSFIYMLLSWASIPFIRAFTALILYKICPFIDRKADAVHIVTIICLTIIAFNPIQVLFLDFQLSFLLTFTLAVISKIEISNNRKQHLFKI